MKGMHHIDRRDQVTHVRRVKSAAKETNSGPRCMLVNESRRRIGHRGSLRAHISGSLGAHILGQQQRLIDMKYLPKAKIDTFLTIQKVLLKSRLIPAES
jgi:hypothetical protein